MRARSRAHKLAVSPVRLRAARLAARLSLAQLAAGICTRQHVHLVERGRTRASLPIFLRLAERLQLPPEALLEPGREGSGQGHWPGCWRQHHACAVSIVELLLGQAPGREVQHLGAQDFPHPSAL